MPDSSADSSALAFRAAIEMLAEATPGAHHELRAHGTLLAITGAMIPALNPILSPAAEPDVDEIVALAEVAGREAGRSPWSIRIRDEPHAKLVEVAQRSGLSTKATQPFMVRSLDGEPSAGEIPVRRLAGRDYAEFAAVLGAGFGVPAEIISGVFTEQVLDHPQITAYIADSDNGVAAAAAIAFVTDRHLGMANFVWLPELHGPDYGGAVIEASLRDGRAAGAHTAYVHATDSLVPYFETFGFTTREHWSMLSAF